MTIFPQEIQWNPHIQEGDPDLLDILIFDCCRGNIKKELNKNNKKTTEVEDGELYNDLPNVYYKNVIIIHSTLPNQVQSSTETSEIVSL